MTPNERWELLKAELDGREFRSVTATMSAARSTRARHNKRATRQWERSRFRKPLKSGKMPVYCRRVSGGCSLSFLSSGGFTISVCIMRTTNGDRRLVSNFGG
jgi:hypothetical protein